MSELELSQESIYIAAEIQKITMKAICELTSADKVTAFNEQTLAIVLIICNLMLSNRIDKIDEFLQDIVLNVKNLYPGVKENANCYFIKRDGNIDEGMIQ